MYKLKKKFEEFDDDFEVIEEVKEVEVNYKKGDKLVYKTQEIVEVLKVHFDNIEPYYTIKMSNGNEKQTICKNLSRVNKSKEENSKQGRVTDFISNIEGGYKCKLCNKIYKKLGKCIEKHLITHNRKFIFLLRFKMVLANVFCVNKISQQFNSIQALSITLLFAEIVHESKRLAVFWTLPANHQS